MNKWNQKLLLLSNTKRMKVFRYVGPLILGLLALALQIYFRDLIGTRYFLFVSPALYLGAALSGMVPGLVASVVLLISTWYYFIPHTHTFQNNNPSDAFALFISFLICILFSVLGGIARKNKVKEKKNQLTIDQTNTKLIVAIKAREEILAIVTHDLKSPLSSIQQINQMLLNTKVGEQEKMLGLVGLIQDSTDQMERLITDLMDFSKIQDGKLYINKRMENPNDVIKLIADLMDIRIKEKGLLFTSEVCPTVTTLAYDKYRILQVLFNLVGNAIKFTPRNGSIHLTVKESAGGVTFSVADTGVGIDPENHLNVFDRYWQAERTNGFSAGLGLAITKGIIEAHEGKIWIESQPTKGSTFHFELP